MAALRPAGDFDRSYEQDMAVVRRPWQWAGLVVGLLVVLSAPLWGSAYLTMLSRGVTQ